MRADLDPHVTAAARIPAASISLTSGGKPMAQRFIASASGSSTRFTTNSPTSRMLLVVSLAPPDAATPRPSTTIGGSSASTLKKLKGAACRDRRASGS